MAAGGLEFRILEGGCAPLGFALGVDALEILADARSLDYARDARHGRKGIVGARRSEEIGMHALRGGDVVGAVMVLSEMVPERSVARGARVCEWQWMRSTGGRPPRSTL